MAIDLSKMFDRFLVYRRQARRERCRDIVWCSRIDRKQCCFDRVEAERSLTRLRDERAMWAGWP